jgi:hypothetical protein
MGKGRELVWRKEGSFEGWKCTACGWLRPNPHLIAKNQISSLEVGEAFDAHQCAKFPLLKKPREDMNQAAARIVREATEKD